jgi:photosystem II stability/assembly factor-like uncharacterized protein
MAGTQPAGLYRSGDGGKSWRNLEVPIKPYALTGYYLGDKPYPEGHPGAYGRKHWTRVTQIVFDPVDSSRVWAGVEIDGAWRSRDGGEHWERSGDGLKTQDIHGFAVVHNGKRVLLATTDAGLHVSCDDGASWTMQPIDSDWQYTRSIVERTDKTGVMFMTNGNGPPGTAGRLFRSRNYGADWEDVRLPSEAESSVYFLAVNRADQNLVYAAATLGQIWRSTDGGESWTPVKRRLGEIRANRAEVASIFLCFQLGEPLTQRTFFLPTAGFVTNDRGDCLDLLCRRAQQRDGEGDGEAPAVFM